MFILPLKIVVLILVLKMKRHCAAGAFVRVLCSGSLGPHTSDLPAEGRGWPGAHTQGGLPRPGGWSGAWRLCSGKKIQTSSVSVKLDSSFVPQLVKYRSPFFLIIHSYLNSFLCCVYQA